LYAFKVRAKLLKVFSEKVTPGLHDKFLMVDGFGGWKADYLEKSLKLQEKEIEKKHQQKAKEALEK
jgi:hypothetical protein